VKKRLSTRALVTSPDSDALAPISYCKLFVWNIFHATRLFSIFCKNKHDNSSPKPILFNILALRDLEKIFAVIHLACLSGSVPVLCVE